MSKEELLIFFPTNLLFPTFLYLQKDDLIHPDL